MNTKDLYRPSIDSALILSPDPLGAALVAAAVEAAGIRPHFAASSETARSALRRVKPTAVVISADAWCLREEEFLGPAKMTGARLFVYGTDRQLEAVRAVVARYDIDAIMLPRDASDLGRRIRGASGSSLRQPESTAR